MPNANFVCRCKNLYRNIVWLRKPNGHTVKETKAFLYNCARNPSQYRKRRFSPKGGYALLINLQDIFSVGRRICFRRGSGAKPKADRFQKTNVM